MDLKTFITETLHQICDGVREAQLREGGGAINAAGADKAGGHLYSGAGSGGTFTRVDFDVAVSAETEGGGKGGIKVFSVGVEAGAGHKTGYANRSTFSVPVRLPDGDKAKHDFNRPLDYPKTSVA